MYIPDDISPFCSAATPFQYSSSACVLNSKYLQQIVDTMVTILTSVIFCCNGVDFNLCLSISCLERNSALHCSRNKTNSSVSTCTY